MVGREEAFEELRRVVAAREFVFATVLEVTDGGPDGFLFRVRSGKRLHPHTVVVAADERSLAIDHSIGLPLDDDDARLWAYGVGTWLEEQLDTGALRWGRRLTLADGTVAIDPSLEPEPPSRWSLNTVPLERPTAEGQRRLRRLSRERRSRRIVILGDGIPHEPDPAPGGYVRGLAFDVRPGRRAHAEGRLIQWWLLNLNDASVDAPPVGQLVVAWLDGSETVAELAYLETKPSVAPDGLEQLVLAGVHAAADAGAEVIEHHLDIDHTQLGLPWQAEGDTRRLNAADVP